MQYCDDKTTHTQKKHLSNASTAVSQVYTVHQQFLCDYYQIDMSKLFFFFYLIMFNYVSEAMRKKWAFVAHPKTMLLDVVSLCKRCSQTLARNPKVLFFAKKKKKKKKVKLETRNKSKQPKSYVCVFVQTPFYDMMTAFSFLCIL